MVKKKNKVTLVDLAEAAGVSPSTVSRALKNDKRISKKVTDEIQQMASEFGYLPDITARSLKTGHTNIIGLLVRDISDEWSGALIPFIERECTAHNYALLLSNADSSKERENYYLEIFQQRNAEGVLILTPLSSDQSQYIKCSIPLVLVDTYLKEPRINAITVDHELGAFLSTKHLIQLGHKNIAFISGPLNISPSKQYRHGFKRALETSDIKFQESQFLAVSSIDIRHGYSAMSKILIQNPTISGIATGSDLMAAGAMLAIRDAGLKIPNDKSIIGYDDIPLSALLSPPLSTVKQDRELLAKLAVETLISAIQDKDLQPRQQTIPPELIIRGSTTGK